jgi:uncharacterized protein (TIGR00288 family)
MNKDKFAVFIDAENLTSWIKDDGPAKLLKDLSSIGQVIVRRAYGKWTNSNLNQLQEILNRNGFELLHNFHPVSGKNSSDIQMTVDAMEYALKLNDVDWFVLATGDSDFSPLFRKLREIGKEVIGIGPKSPLSECVKTSCSRYIYTFQDKALEEDVIALEKEDAEDLLESILSKTDSPINLSSLKNQMLQVDSAFNEKRLGFKNFSSYVESMDFLKLENDMVKYRKQPKNKHGVDESSNTPIDTKAYYKKILKQMNWNVTPKALLEQLYKKAITFHSMSRQLLVNNLLACNFEGTSSSLIKNTLGIFFKSKLVQILPTDDDDDKNWKIIKIDEYLRNIDIAMLSRLVSGIKKDGNEVRHDILRILCYGKYSTNEFDAIIKQAEENSKTNEE